MVDNSFFIFVFFDDRSALPLGSSKNLNNLNRSTFGRSQGENFLIAAVVNVVIVVFVVFYNFGRSPVRVSTKSVAENCLAWQGWPVNSGTVEMP